METKPEKETRERFKFFHEKAVQTGTDFASCLKIIQEEKLYRYDYSSFEKYVETTFHIGKSQAYRLIEFSKYEPSPIGGQITNERQARAISEVPEQQREKVIYEASKKGKVTAKSIEQVAATLSDPPSDENEPVKPEYDQTGYLVPKRSLHVWHRRGEITKILHMISEVKEALKKYEGKEDVLFKRNPPSGPITSMENAYSELKTCLPYAVCPYCQGQVPENCLTCLGSGFVSQRIWATAVPEELKQVRERAIELRKVEAA